MDCSFSITFGQNAFMGHASPAQCGDLKMHVQYVGGPIELSAISFSIRLDQTPVWPERHQVIQPYVSSSQHWDYYFLLRVPLDSVTVAFIERIRQNSGPLNFTVSVNFLYHRLIPASQPNDSSAAVPQYMLGVGETKHAQAVCTVQRDEWLELLKTIGWQEYEVFEVPTGPLRRVERFANALDLLDQATKAFRSGDYDACVVHTRRAVETAVTDNTKKAYEQFWCDVCPDEVDKPKRDALNHFALGIVELRHLAAHASSKLRRSDAQLALTITIAVFRYLGEEWARTHDTE